MEEKKQNPHKKRSRNRETTVITYFFLLLFLLMMIYFVYFQVIKSETFINSPYNSLQDLFSERIIRGDIVSADGYTLATTKVSSDGTETREYPYGRMFAHVVGYAVNGKAGLENQENFSLLRSHEFILTQILNDLEDKKSGGDTVVTTLNYEIQKTAYDALGKYDGAVIVMEPETGKVLCMVSKPDYDPNTVLADWDTINAEGSSVLYNRATQGKYAPGSVFKIFTALEYYRENPDSYEAYSYDCSGQINVDGRVIHCASNKAHGEESLLDSFADSCNASFANLGLTLDLAAFSKGNNDLLFNTSLPIAFESSKSSFSLSSGDSDYLVMETAIGQGNTLVSPLHMCLVASAVANDGVLMRPYLVDRVESVEGDEVDSNSPQEYGTLLTGAEADFLQEFMRSVVTDGTASRLNDQSYEAYGKTGTAQVSDTTDETNAWFVGYAHREGQKDIAIAVVVEDSGSGSSYAVPIAKAVFDVYFD